MSTQKPINYPKHSPLMACCFGVAAVVVVVMT
jgi:hypothetical protein